MMTIKMSTKESRRQYRALGRLTFLTLLLLIAVLSIAPPSRAVSLRRKMAATLLAGENEAGGGAAALGPSPVAPPTVPSHESPTAAHLPTVHQSGDVPGARQPRDSKRASPSFGTHDESLDYEPSTSMSSGSSWVPSEASDASYHPVESFSFARQQTKRPKPNPEFPQASRKGKRPAVQNPTLAASSPSSRPPPSPPTSIFDEAESSRQPTQGGRRKRWSRRKATPIHEPDGLPSAVQYWFRRDSLAKLHAKIDAGEGNGPTRALANYHAKMCRAEEKKFAEAGVGLPPRPPPCTNPVMGIAPAAWKRLSAKTHVFLHTHAERHATYSASPKTPPEPEIERFLGERARVVITLNNLRKRHSRKLGYEGVVPQAVRDVPYLPPPPPKILAHQEELAKQGSAAASREYAQAVTRPKRWARVQEMRKAVGDRDPAEVLKDKELIMYKYAHAAGFHEPTFHDKWIASWHSTGKRLIRAKESQRANPLPEKSATRWDWVYKSRLPAPSTAAGDSQAGPSAPASHVVTDGAPRRNDKRSKSRISRVGRAAPSTTPTRSGMEADGRSWISRWRAPLPHPVLDRSSEEPIPKKMRTVLPP